MAEKIKIFYNPRCTKCREALCLIEEKGKKADIVEYLKDIPSEKQLKEVIGLLKIKPEELLRKKEPLFEKKFKNKKISDAQWIKVMVKNPILIERPIIIKGKKAVIGRPPEKVLELI